MADCFAVSSALHHHDNHHRSVCCMCGDVGFQDQLFKCKKCLRRFQHSYCSSSYLQAGWKIGVCEWCHYEEKTNIRRPSGSNMSCSKRKSNNGEERSAGEQQHNVIPLGPEQYDRKSVNVDISPSVYGDLIWRPSESEDESAHKKCSRQHPEKNCTVLRDHSKGKINTVTSPRAANRRYKLLKDVLC